MARKNEDKEVALKADELDKREKELVEVEEHLALKADELDKREKELIESGKNLDDKAAALCEQEETLLEQSIATDEKLALIRESAGDPQGKVRVLRVKSKVAPGFCRAGFHFSVAGPELLSMAELSMEQIKALRDEPNLDVKEILA